MPSQRLFTPFHPLPRKIQLRTLDKRRLREKMGRVDKELMDRVDAAIAVSFGLHSERLV